MLVNQIVTSNQTGLLKCGVGDPWERIGVPNNTRQRKRAKNRNEMARQ